MLEQYNIELITKTINKVTHINEEELEFSTTHNDEGVIEIRIFDTKNNNSLVKTQYFDTPIIERSEVFNWIQTIIDNYESNNPFISDISFVEFQITDEFADIILSIKASEEYIEKYDFIESNDTTTLFMTFDLQGNYKHHSICDEGIPVDLILGEEELGEVFDYIYSNNLKEKLIEEILNSNGGRKQKL